MSSRLVNMNLKLKDGRNMMVTVDEDKVDRFRNGPDKLLDALAEKYPHSLPTKPVYINVEDNNSTGLIVSEIDQPDSNLEDIHVNGPVITGKERRVQLGTFHWERNDVLTLIRLRTEKEPIFNKFGIRKKDVWVMIAEEFQAKGFNVTSGQCEQKWKNITKNYRDTVDYSYFSNTHRECPFFKELSAVYHYDPKEKHAGAHPGMSLPGLAGGNNVFGGPKNNNLSAMTNVSSGDGFSNYNELDTAGNSSVVISENNLSEALQQDTYLQEVTPDLSVEALFQAPEIKQEIMDEDDQVIVIPSSPPDPPSRHQPLPSLPQPVPTMVTTAVGPLLTSNIVSPSFQSHALSQPASSSPNMPLGNIPTSSSMLLPPMSSSSLPDSMNQSIIKHESMPQEYTAPMISNICLPPAMPEVLQTQQMNNTTLTTSFTPMPPPMPPHSSSQAHQQRQTPPVNSNSLARKRARDSLRFTSSSSSSSSSSDRAGKGPSSTSNSVSDLLAYRRRLLRRTNFSVPNNMLDMLKQMNEERRREHRTLISTLNQQHEDILDLFKQQQQEYLHQEEIKQALLTELIDRITKQ